MTRAIHVANNTVAGSVIKFKTQERKTVAHPFSSVNNEHVI